jgi:hypothetical protein
MYATCPRSASSGYHPDFHEEHVTIGEWQGRDMACVNERSTAWRGMGMVCVN